MTDRQLLQQALDALTKYHYYTLDMGHPNHSMLHEGFNAVTALRDRLAHCDRCGKRLGGEGDIHTCTPKPARKPVAWVNHGENRIIRVTGWDGYGALYDTPPAAPKSAEWAKFLHYPDCWDTAAYPTLSHAVHETLACFACGTCTTDPIGDAQDKLIAEMAAQPEPVQKPVATMRMLHTYGDITPPAAPMTEFEEAVAACDNTLHYAIDYWQDRAIKAETLLAQPEQEPVSMRMPKAGDKVICLEDESLATVVSLTAGGSPDIVFSDGSRGTYLLHEFAELFGYFTPPAAQPAMFGPMGTVGDLFDKHVIANGNLKKEWIVYLEKNT